MIDENLARTFAVNEFTANGIPVGDVGAHRLAHGWRFRPESLTVDADPESLGSFDVIVADDGTVFVVAAAVSDADVEARLKAS